MSSEEAGERGWDGPVWPPGLVYGNAVSDVTLRERHIVERYSAKVNELKLSLESGSIAAVAMMVQSLCFVHDAAQKDSSCFVTSSSGFIW